jgi:acyl dehydratase
MAMNADATDLAGLPALQGRQLGPSAWRQVPVGARIRTSADVLEVKEIAGGVQLKVGATVEVEGGEKPAVVAECLFRFYE